MAKKKAVKKTAVKKGSAEAKRKMAKVRKAKKNYVVVEKDRQTKVKTTNSGGYIYPYNKAKDKIRKAMPPGKRISKKTGNAYWEYRVNRSDKKGSLTGEKHYDTNSHNYNFTISGIADLKKQRDINENQVAETMNRINNLMYEIKVGFYKGIDLKNAKMSLAKNKVHLQFLKFNLKKLNDRINKNIK